MTNEEKLRALLAEARAEVERLRGIAMHPTGVTWERHHENLKQIALEEVHAAHAALDEAYQRGAEAMREAAAKTFECNGEGGCFAGRWADKPCLSCGRATDVRALPLPEEKL